MTNKKDKRLHSTIKRECFELENLLQAYNNTLGIPEPAQLNHLEEAGNYMIYLSKLTKQSDDNGHS